MATMDREKALETAMAQIERQHGKGAVMRLGDETRAPINVIPTGSIALDVALGIGGLPRGRVVEIYGPESSGKTTVALHAVAQAQAAGGIAAFIDAEHALDPAYAKALGVDTDGLLVSQPDTGEQALEITDMLIRSGALDIIVIDSVAALVPRAEIEGEMGDSHVGLQARLMSQALRKITGALNQSQTTAIFINQLREKIGVMFGCLSYNTRVTLADGTQEKIGKIVNQKLPVEVLSYDQEAGAVVPKRVVNWFDNGVTEEFLQFTVARPGGNGRSQMALTSNHLVRTPGGWREAGEIQAGDRVMLAQAHRLSEMQWQVVLGGLMGDGALSPSRIPGSLGTRFRMGHSAKQVDYLDWKASLLGNIPQTRSTNARGATFVDLTPLPELAELREAVYLGGKKVLSWDYLKALTPLSLAIWYMDDGGFTVRAKGLQERTREGSGRAEICIEALSEGSRERLVEHLAGAFDLHPALALRGSAQTAVLTFARDETAKLHALLAPYVHPSMDYKLLERFRGRFAVEPEFVEPRILPVPAPVIDVHVKPKTRSMHRFDIEVEGSHNYLADGVIVHNSPETTTGGRALKFYASIRLDVRRIETLKDGSEAVGNRTRVKVVKNKCLAAGTKIFDPTTARVQSVEDIVDNRLPVSVVAAAKDGTLHTRPVVSWFDQGEQDVIGLRLADTTLWATPDHQVLTDRGWVVAGEITTSDRVARPRQFGSFGDRRPISADAARLLGSQLTGDDACLPAELFADDIAEDVLANLVFGLLETDGHVSREQTGAIRLGYSTTSEQLAHQLHWLLLRWGITSTVRERDPREQRPSLIGGRRVISQRPIWEVRIAGVDNVERFAEVVPLWGPRGTVLADALASMPGRRRGGQSVYLPANQGAPVLAHLATRGVTAETAAMLIGDIAGNPRGGMKQVLGVHRLRRDRLVRLADALDDDFLRGVLAEQVSYARVRDVLPARRARTFDVEVDDLHTLVAEGVVVHNCAPPFKQAEFDIVYGSGISREGSLIDVGVEQGIVRKSGAWYTYEGDQLGQGKENARTFLRDNPDLANEIEKKIKEKLGVGAVLDAEAAPAAPPVDF